ncbi:MAG: hypothetical protein DHS20C13_10200 [Thermodesulfobacteriota bacterium]|nr:MAG: hypothetical protein DHS20C13_10200 [Thermodesulfobacteriota bacterium]
MNNTLIISLFLAVAFIIPNLCYAIPAPCTQEQLLESSDFAIEGTVTKVECGEPYESKQCSAKDGIEGFVPELVAKCKATVKVSDNIKGKYNKGDEVVIPYLQLVQQCENGTHMIPGSPLKVFVPNSVIKYYNSEQCKYWNYLQISVPPSNN